MKRYAVFAWQDFEAKGGWKDVVETFDILERATAAAQHTVESETVERYDTEAQVVDLQESSVVASFRRRET